MGKSRHGQKELTRERTLAKENRELKQELIHLRKQIARVDKKSLEVTKKMSKDHEERKTVTTEPNENLEHLKRTWSCNECSTGFLEITLYSKIGVTHYFRKCNQCPNRTKGQRYNEESVKGIIKNE
jgi:predicted RNase H-like nuclease (RuvC/YqgF family)